MQNRSVPREERGTRLPKYSHLLPEMRTRHRLANAAVLVPREVRQTLQIVDSVVVVVCRMSPRCRIQLVPRHELMTPAPPLRHHIIEPNPRGIVHERIGDVHEAVQVPRIVRPDLVRLVHVTEFTLEGMHRPPSMAS